MRVAILGGGFTGLTAAFYLQNKGHEVTLIEKEKTLGGLAVGFKAAGWDWYLDCFYHHLLDSENDILRFANNIGFNDLFFKTTSTGSLYRVQNNYRIFPVDSPQDFLKFPLLSLPQKIRAGVVVAGLKLSPFLRTYEEQTAKEFLSKTMGSGVWNIFWQELFRKKFGKYAENILATFIWARIKKRAKNLGYVKGGFQTLINYAEMVICRAGATIIKEANIVRLEKKTRGQFQVTINVNADKDVRVFDAVISTLPTPTLAALSHEIFPAKLTQNLRKLKHLHAVALTIESNQPILKDTYWLNICTPDLPMVLIAQHTNFIDKKHYGGRHLAYVAWYVDGESPLLKMDNKQVWQYIKPSISKLTRNELTVTNSYLSKAFYAQPVFDKTFLINKPTLETPVKNFFIANLDMTYPYDRGANYAVKIGREAADALLLAG